MKSIACVICSMFVLTANAQFSIDWFTIDGGGGTSTGGGYTVNGTIGQPDAGPIAGGGYTLVGGFWALPIAVQSPGSPTLSITPAVMPGMVSISWTPNTPGFVLQSADVLLPTAWTNAPSGATNPVTLPTGTAARFFRLRN